ncbi:PREDICTED: endo-1,3;1,4-beta-D-glucanase-like [Tarenaya hassleriana]|uniref:endo-1,3;1,4-beta-D-glucanase-like n=1 Tax=Tarenaya hassleriana TaxID=28532 RepID=UPI00053C4656|nr:PREDICTED: endo-1,3;1,4-beta-D-glucanase-like [Tarenaya hassleriana]
MAMMGPQCCQNPPVKIPNAGSGHVEKLGGLDAYVTGSPDSKFAILLASDAFGFEAPNLRKLADKVAAAGFYVVVPDFFHGDSYTPENQDRPLPVWIKDHGPEKGFEYSKPVIEALKSKGIDAIGATGVCFGAKVVVELAKRQLIQSAVLLHPSLVSVDDIKEVKTPIAVLGAEIDGTTPPELVKKFSEALASKPDVKSYVKIYPNVEHGWSVRYEESDAEAVKAAEEAHKDMLEWSLIHVK